MFSCSTQAICRGASYCLSIRTSSTLYPSPHQFGYRRRYSDSHAVALAIHWSGKQLTSTSLLLQYFWICQKPSTVSAMMSFSLDSSKKEPPGLWRLICSWLTKRSFSVPFHGCLSKSFYARHSISQGCALSVILCHIYIMDGMLHSAMNTLSSWMTSRSLPLLTATNGSRRSIR